MTVISLLRGGVTKFRQAKPARPSGFGKGLATVCLVSSNKHNAAMRPETTVGAVYGAAKREKFPC